MNLSKPRINSMCVYLQGFGTDEETIVEILSTRSRKRLQDINIAYQHCKLQNLKCF